MTTDRINYLLSQYLDDNATIAERDELAGILSQPETIPVVTDRLQAMIDSSQQEHQWSTDKLDQMLQNVLNSDKTGEEITFAPVRRMFSWKKIAVAASILLVIGFGTAALVGVFTNKTKQEIAITQEQRFKNDVNPGGYKARLTLADGRIIVLDSAASGELAKQGKTVVLNKDGQLVYDASHSPLTTDHSPIYNTLSTAKGETYTTVLADGSKVWLNSASSIKYPVSFTGNERRVEITGEAYFEVAKSVTARGAKQPFIVSKGEMQVQVLGTHFNVNAYDDEQDIKVTLLEGSVQVSALFAKNSAPSAVKIKPGQQAVLTHDSQLTTHNVNTNQAVAWVNGIFDCNGLDIAAIMRQVGRWYDVDITIEPGVTKDKFAGRIPRTVTLASLLKVLELNEVKFTIDGKKIKVMK